MLFMSCYKPAKTCIIITTIFLQYLQQVFFYNVAKNDYNICNRHDD